MLLDGGKPEQTPYREPALSERSESNGELAPARGCPEVGHHPYRHKLRCSRQKSRSYHHPPFSKGAPRSLRKRDYTVGKDFRQRISFSDFMAGALRFNSQRFQWNFYLKESILHSNQWIERVAGSIREKHFTCGISQSPGNTPRNNDCWWHGQTRRRWLAS